jgi:hypothetical protein
LSCSTLGHVQDRHAQSRVLLARSPDGRVCRWRGRRTRARGPPRPGTWRRAAGLGPSPACRRWRPQRAGSVAMACPSSSASWAGERSRHRAACPSRSQPGGAEDRRQEMPAARWGERLTSLVCC